MDTTRDQHSPIGPRPRQPEPDELEPDPCACLTRPCSCEEPWDTEDPEPDEDREPEDAAEEGSGPPCAPGSELAEWFGGALSARAQQCEAAGAPAPSHPPTPRAQPAGPPSPRPEPIGVESLAPPGRLILIVGRPGSRKSTLALEAVTAYVTGTLALGLYRVIGSGAILLVIGRGDNRAGVERWLASLPQEAQRRIVLAPEDTHIHTAAGQGVIRDLCAKHGVGLIIVDSLASCALGVPENDADSMAPVMAFLAGLDPTVLLVHHRRKGSREREDPLDSIRGSGAIAAAADVVLLLRAHGRESCSTVHPVAKRVDPATLAGPFLAQRQPDGRLRRLSDYDPEGEDDDRLLRLLAEHEGATPAALAKASGTYTLPEMRARLERVGEQGRAVREGYRWYTTVGRERAKARAEAEAGDLEARAAPIADLVASYPDHVELLRAIHSAGPTRKSVGKALGVSASTVSRRLKELSKLLEEHGLDALVETARGNSGGCKLNPLGRAVVARLDVIEAEAAARFEEAAKELRLDEGQRG